MAQSNRKARGRGKPGPGRPWVKGQSGNPGGLPHWVKEVREFCGMHSLEAAKRVLRLSKSKDDRIALAACEAILDRAGARPIQPISGVDGGPILVEVRDVRERLVQRLSALAASRAGARGAEPE